MAQAEKDNLEMYSVTNQSGNGSEIERLNFSVDNALKPKNRMPDYICSRLEQDRWRVTYTLDERGDEIIETDAEAVNAEEIAAEIDSAYQASFN